MVDKALDNNFIRNILSYEQAFFSLDLKIIFKKETFLF